MLVDTKQKKTFFLEKKGEFVITYARRLVPGEHPPRVPVQVLAIRGVLGFTEAVHVLGGQAGRNLDEHVAERERGQLRIPARMGQKNDKMVISASCSAGDPSKDNSFLNVLLCTKIGIKLLCLSRKVREH